MLIMARASRRHFHFMYKTTCHVTGRWYIGIHSTDNIYDGYLGSGTRMLNSLKKHGRDAHSREILEFLETRELLCEKEEQIVTEELLNDELCMNLMPGGTARRMSAGKDTRERMRLAKLGKKQSPEMIAARSAALKGRVQSVETKEKLRTIARAQWERRYAGDESAVGKRKAS